MDQTNEHDVTELIGLLEKTKRQLTNALTEVAKLTPNRVPKTLKYYDYLESREWEHKRDQVIDREAGECQGCQSEPIEHIHHTTYTHLYDEPLFQLVGLCENCHRKVHFFGESFNPWEK